MSDQNQDLKHKSLQELKQESEAYGILQKSAKGIINDFYGTFGNEYYYFSDFDIAETITTLGRDLIQFANKVTNHYFRKLWHKDIKLHKKLGIENYVIHPVDESIDTAVYSDTDSNLSETEITINNKDFLFEEAFEFFKQKYGSYISMSGHEKINLKGEHTILNYDEKKGVYQAPLTHLIRRRVNKERWKLTTKSGKQVTVTEDHSLIVIRDNQKIEVKPKDIDKKTDKVIAIKKPKN